MGFVVRGGVAPERRPRTPSATGRGDPVALLDSAALRCRAVPPRSAAAQCRRAAAGTSAAVQRSRLIRSHRQAKTESAAIALEPPGTAGLRSP